MRQAQIRKVADSVETIVKTLSVPTANATLKDEYDDGAAHVFGAQANWRW